MRESPPVDQHTTSADVFEQYRPLLFSIAYRMLGSVVEAEDAVQEAFLRFTAASDTDIRSPRAYLSTIVTRLCLDQLKSARRTRESYIGPWLPEPLVTGAAGGSRTPADVVEDHDSVSMAFLVLLESLTPVERAVFLLHEVFDYGYDEVARIVGRSEPACRQILHRAREHVRARRPRFASTREAQERLVQGFLHACQGGDLGEMIAMLADDVTFWSDGGGKRPATMRPVFGADRVARLITGLINKSNAFEHYRIAFADVNAKPGLLFIVDDQVELAAAFDTHAGRIQAIWAVANPDKLTTLRPPPA
jgi:RNA polymerase sigma-70 factor (ECF subfamily)